MRVYFAPMEGITGYIYRNAFHAYFGQGIDKYFTPFIAVAQGGDIKNRSLRDVLPENNRELPVVPQILTNRAADFTALRKRLVSLGYGEVNLNLGCPYPTVVSKGKGAGFLARKEELTVFLEEIFKACGEGESISVKTRLGRERPEEFEEILAIYQQFPIRELIIHPRVQRQLYEGKPDRKAFAEALCRSSHPVCYNGDIVTRKDYEELTEEFPPERFPGLAAVMIGRGFLINPGLVRELRQGERMTKKEFADFHERLYEDYRELMGEDRNALFKMKELWNYWQYLWEMQNETDREKHLKKIRKAKTGGEYLTAVNALLGESAIAKMPGWQ